MPVEKYNRYFGGKGGARKALRAMKEEYGEEKGESVFYATKNKRAKSKRKNRAREDNLGGLRVGLQR